MFRKNLFVLSVLLICAGSVWSMPMLSKNLQTEDLALSVDVGYEYSDNVWKFQLNNKGNIAVDLFTAGLSQGIWTNINQETAGDVGASFYQFSEDSDSVAIAGYFFKTIKPGETSKILVLAADGFDSLNDKVYVSVAGGGRAATGEINLHAPEPATIFFLAVSGLPLLLKRKK